MGSEGGGRSVIERVAELRNRPGSTADSGRSEPGAAAASPARVHWPDPLRRPRLLPRP